MIHYAAQGRGRRGSPLDELYFSWLIRKEGLDFVSCTMNQLRVMYKTPFEVFVRGDKNRVWDAYSLREEFLSYIDPVQASNEDLDSWSCFQCSVLEVLVVMARVGAYQDGRSTTDWFEEMTANMDVGETPEDARRAVKRFVRRSYSYNGEGGAFPLRNPVEDQREVELWYQLSAYVIENSTLVIDDSTIDISEEWC